MGSEDEIGTMPSGVDWREPLRYEAVKAGLPREPGILIAAVMRAKLGWGEGMRGRGQASWSSDMVAVNVKAQLEGLSMLLHDASRREGSGMASGRH